MSKKAVITGASRGIGRIIAQHLYSKGISLILIARSKSGLEETKNIINPKANDIYCIQHDLSKNKNIENLVQKINTNVGKIDYLINNAGVEKYKKFQNYKSNEIKEMIHVNLLTPIELTRYSLNSILKKNSHIINIASLAGKKGVAFNSIYSTTKSGLIMWSDALRQEFKYSNIKISVISPGFVKNAGMHHALGVPAPKSMGSVKPEEVANAVYKCITTNKSQEITISNIPIRPLLALGQLFPKFGDRVVNWFGINKASKNKIQ